ncbi:MAG: N-acetylmuramoyl-L-alanine amidase [Candidatus Parcubacteria bacterium]|nr:N-acetylmuramoyl-L-alanine amidase [Candidatus Parcubacteria bacterium]
MRRRIKWILGILVFLSFLLVFLNYFKILSFHDIKNLASVFFVESVTEQQLKNKYINGEVKILIVPGHDDEFWGTDFSGIKEANLNLDLAKELSKLLISEKEFEIILLRDDNGYNESFLNYFNKERHSIEKFIQKQKQTTENLMTSGLIEEKEGVPHTNISLERVIKLYGINKWANENKIDIVINIHFNDYPRKNNNRVGEYSGFSIYVPEKQFSNAGASRALANPIFERLKKYFPVSNMPKEKRGIIDDQKLIALGANNSLDSAALLIEYGYIYESQFMNKKNRPLVFKKLATQTYLGIIDFF